MSAMSTDRCPHCGAVASHGKIANIQKVVAAYYDLAGWEMLSDRRARPVAWPRQVAMYLARELTGKSLPVIGRQFNRDHTTVIHAISAVEGRSEHSAGQRADLAYLRGALAA